ncbi:MAG TPA: BTAD domain-containing putative transcriptional regulator, partial [Longimicrobiales bacterium]|nr:BTAD domain-containing putative transcriptional regulator [Longimicrobiales bacterium]
YLLLHPGGRSRDQVGDALWPEATDARAKNSFHVTLHHLRKALGHPEWIGIEGERYRVEPRVTVRFDAQEFEARGRAALAADDPDGLAAALALYRGGLLEGDSVGRWVEEHRERLQRLHADLALALGRHLERDDPAKAAEHYRALAAREELDEEVHRRLMSALARSGDRVAALRHYERLTALLDRALEAEPEAETRDLYDLIRSGAA